jgi:acyl carrier protein
VPAVLRVPPATRRRARRGGHPLSTRRALTLLEARAAVVDAISFVAPDAAPRVDRLDDATRLHDDAGLDSTDFLALAERLAATTGIDVPEADLCELETVGRASRYLVAASTTRATRSSTGV